MSKGFLELGLKPGESLRIGNGISVTVVRIDLEGRSPAVELGVSAPREVKVQREEIYNRINGIDERVRRFPVRKKNAQPSKKTKKRPKVNAAPQPEASMTEPLAGYVSGEAVSSPRTAKITVKKRRLFGREGMI